MDFKSNIPNIHAKYKNQKATFNILTKEIIYGYFPIMGIEFVQK